MIDLAIVLVFVVYSVAVGFQSRHSAYKDLSEYLLAGRTIRGWHAGVSMAATQYAADTPPLVTGLVAVGGIFAIWRLWIYGLAFLFMGFLLGQAWRRAGVLTDAELTEIRYSGRGVTLLRGLKAIYYGTVINCVVMAFVLVAATRIFEIFLPWHLWLRAGLYEALHGAVHATGAGAVVGNAPARSGGRNDPYARSCYQRHPETRMDNRLRRMGSSSGIEYRVRHSSILFKSSGTWLRCARSLRAET